MPWENTVGQARLASTATNIAAIVFFICLVLGFCYVLLNNRRECQETKSRSSHNAVIRVYDDAGNVIESHEHKGEFREP